MRLKHSLTVLGLLAVTDCAFAQQQRSSATSTISATIATPVSVSKSVNMTWGNITVSPSQGGSIIMDPNGKENPSGGITISNENGVPASFTVSGQGNYTYSINLPTAPVAMDDESANLLNITSFTTSTGNVQSGTQTINVGATLNLEKAESAGEFDGEVPFDVRVNYN